jgi:hypothetical protein
MMRFFQFDAIVLCFVRNAADLINAGALRSSPAVSLKADALAKPLNHSDFHASVTVDRPLFGFTSSSVPCFYEMIHLAAFYFPN